MDSANQLPVMASRRLVIVRRAEQLLKSRAVEAPEGGGESALAGYLRAPSPTTCLVLVGEKPDARLKLTKALAAAGIVCDLSSPTDQALAAWLERHARRIGKRLAPGAAELLVTYANNALAGAAGELDKLALYVGDAQEITVRDVEQAVADRGGAIVWKFTDALKARDAQGALKALARYLSGFRREEDAFFPLLGTIRGELRMMLHAREAADSGKLKGRRLAESLAKRLGAHPYRMQIAVEAATRFSRKELLAAHQRLLETDRRLKSSSVPPRVLIEAWVWRFCERGA